MMNKKSDSPSGCLAFKPNKCPRPGRHLDSSLVLPWPDGSRSFRIRNLRRQPWLLEGSHSSILPAGTGISCVLLSHVLANSPVGSLPLEIQVMDGAGTLMDHSPRTRVDGSCVRKKQYPPSCYCLILDKS